MSLPQTVLFDMAWKLLCAAVALLVVTPGTGVRVSVSADSTCLNNSYALLLRLRVAPEAAPLRPRRPSRVPLELIFAAPPHFFEAPVARCCHRVPLLWARLPCVSFRAVPD